jgi:hypothetical protein
MDMHIGTPIEPVNASALRTMFERINGDGIVELTAEAGMYFLTWRRNINSTVQIALPFLWLDDPAQVDALQMAEIYFAQAMRFPQGSFTAAHQHRGEERSEELARSCVARAMSSLPAAPLSASEG